MLRAHGERRCRRGGERLRRHDQPRLALRALGLHLGETVPEHLVLGEGHVLHTTSRDEHDVGRRPADHRIRDLLEFRECLRQLQQHDFRPGEQLGVELVCGEAGEPELLGIAAQGSTTGREVLMHPDAVSSGSRQRQGDRAVLVTDHDGLGTRGIEGERPFDEQQIGRVIRLEVVRLDVGPAAQAAVGELRHQPTVRGGREDFACVVFARFTTS